MHCRFPAGTEFQQGRQSSADLAVPVEEEVRIPKVRVLGFPQNESAVGFPRNESAVELAREEREEQTRTSSGLSRSEQTGTRSGFSRSANPKGGESHSPPVSSLIHRNEE